MRNDRICNSQAISSRIGVCSWSLRPTSPLDLIGRLERLNISAVELQLNQVVDEEATWGDASEQLRDAGIWVASGMVTLGGQELRRLGGNDCRGPASVLSDAAWFANRFMAEQAARVADRACIGLVCMRIGSLPCDDAGPEWAKLADRLGALAEIFSNYGINLAIETGPAPIELIRTLIDQLRLPNMGVNFDPAGVVLGGLGDPVDALKRLSPYTMQIHVRDAAASRNLTGSWREVPVGEGSDQWHELLDVAAAIMPPIHFMIERDPRVAQDADFTAARDLIAYHLAPGSHSMRSP